MHACVPYTVHGNFRWLCMANFWHVHRAQTTHGYPLHTHTHTYTHTQTHTHIKTHTHARARTHTHTQRNTHTRANHRRKEHWITDVSVDIRKVLDNAIITLISFYLTAKLFRDDKKMETNFLRKGLLSFNFTLKFHVRNIGIWKIIIIFFSCDWVHKFTVVISGSFAVKRILSYIKILANNFSFEWYQKCKYLWPNNIVRKENRSKSKTYMDTIAKKSVNFEPFNTLFLLKRSRGPQSSLRNQKRSNEQFLPTQK